MHDEGKWAGTATLRAFRDDRVTLDGKDPRGTD